MGCDIRAFVEYKFGDHWCSFGGQVDFGRNYQLFDAMAGVRGDGAVVSPRGVPDDMALFAREEWRLLEGFSSGWLTTDEFEQAVQKAEVRDVVCRAALVLMQTLDADTEGSRIVFWFHT